MRCVTGAPRSLEDALARDVQRQRESDPLTPIAILLGGTLMRPYLQRRLAERLGGIANVHFLIPSELALVLGERPLLAEGLAHLTGASHPPS